MNGNFNTGDIVIAKLGVKGIYRIINCELSINSSKFVIKYQLIDTRGELWVASEYDMEQRFEPLKDQKVARILYDSSVRGSNEIK